MRKNLSLQVLRAAIPSKTGASKTSSALDATRTGQAAHRTAATPPPWISLRCKTGICAVSTATTAPNWAGANLFRSCLSIPSVRACGHL